MTVAERICVGDRLPFFLYDTPYSARNRFRDLLQASAPLVVVFMAAQLDRVMPEGTQIFRDAMAMFYIANEGLSITENLAIIGVPFPEFIKKALEQIKQQNDEKAE